MKYNYKKAGKIWDDMIDITYDMPDYMDTYARQAERRIFLHTLTRGENPDIYLDYLTENIKFFNEIEEPETAKHLQRIALEIVLFTNDDNIKGV